MDNKKYFEQNQELLLRLANSEAGKALLGVKKDYPIVKIFPSSWHFLADFQNDNPIILANCFCFEKVAKLLLPPLMKMELLRTEAPKLQPIGTEETYDAFLHFAELQQSPHYPQIYLDTKDCYTSSEDGYTGYPGPGLGFNGSWSTCRNAATGGIAKKTESSASCSNGRNDDMGAGYEICRSFWDPDTSSVPSGAIISAVGWVSYSAKNTYAGAAYTVEGTQGSSFTVEDYDQVGSTSWGSKTYSTSWGWQTLDWNSTGIDNINLTGRTTFAMRQYGDFNNDAPDAPNILGTSMRTSEWADYEPYLQITFTAGGAFLFNFI